MSTSQQVRAAIATLRQRPLDFPGNGRRMIEAVSLAKERGANLLLLPEMCVTGYGIEDLYFAPWVVSRAAEGLLVLRTYTREQLSLLVSVPVTTDRGLINGLAFLHRGELVGIIGKRSLPSDGVHYEPRWFSPWPRGEVGRCTIGGQSVPVGDLVFQCGGVAIGAEICEDAWVTERPACDAAGRGINLMVNPSASHYSLGKAERREEVVRSGSERFEGAYLYANLAGNEAGRLLYDGDLLIAEGGRMVSRAKRLTLSEVALTCIDLVLPKREAKGLGVVSLPPLHPRLSIPLAPPPCEPHPTWEEELYLAFTAGLFDYLAAISVSGCVVSLSGGADSSATTAIVELTRRRALRELGQPACSQRAPHLRLQAPDSFLACLYQQTTNNSAATLKAARALTNELDVPLAESNIDDLVRHYRSEGERIEGRPLSWSNDDLTLQNLQSRIRSPLPWLLANMRNALLLTTSNRSEGAVGYTTMDGDTAGGFNLIGGLDKHRLQQWLHWLATRGPAPEGPITSLSHVLALAPSAELRPQEYHQTDERDLMPYAVLATLERVALKERRAPRECVEALPGAPEDRGRWVKRFFTLWSRSQWKRERYAPTLHVDDFNVDPRSWLRFPILSAGYTEELASL